MVRINVAKSAPTPATPTLPKIAVSAAKTADRTAQKTQFSTIRTKAVYTQANPPLLLHENIPGGSGGQRPPAVAGRKPPEAGSEPADTRQPGRQRGHEGQDQQDHVDCIKDDIAQLRKLEVYFTAIGEHRDAQEQVKLIKKLLQVKYDEAVQRMSQKSKQPRKYKALANLFSEFIGYFDDAEIRYKQCRKKTLILAYNRIFERTKRAKHAGDYASAIVSLSRLCENPHCTSEIYAHCQELIQRCDEGIKKPKYDQEKKFIDKRKFSDAINLLVEITDYLDSGQKLEFCRVKLKWNIMVL